MCRDPYRHERQKIAMGGRSKRRTWDGGELINDRLKEGSGDS